MGRMARARRARSPLRPSRRVPETSIDLQSAMADITFVVAPIGGGKSLYATRAICKELARSDRMIVTNVPIFLDSAPEGKMTLQEWAHQYIREPVDVAKRVRRLTHEETFEFWRYLPAGITLPEKERKRPGSHESEIVPDLEYRVSLMQQGLIPHGAFILIDEVHLHFAARDWAKIGNKVEHYMSQLRKLNDDLWLITQHAEKVDKNFRRNSTEWIYLQNMSRARLFAGVSFKGRFRFATYPQMPIRGEAPATAGWLKLEDQEFHQCYDTMAGVGLSGKLAPESSRTKGRHWSVWVVILVAIIALSWYVPRFLMASMGKAIGTSIVSLEKGAASKLHGVTPVKEPVPASAPTPLPMMAKVPPSLAGSASPAGKPTTALKVWMTGMMKTQDGYWVGLSDGRLLSSKDPRMERLTEDGVLYDGVYYTRQLLAR